MGHSRDEIYNDDNYNNNDNDNQDMGHSKDEIYRAINDLEVVYSPLALRNGKRGGVSPCITEIGSLLPCRFSTLALLKMI